MKKVFPLRLRELRKKKSQTQTATYLGVAQTTYSGWETGAREPNIAAISKICMHYGCTSDWLLGIDPAAQPPQPQPASLTLLDAIASNQNKIESESKHLVENPSYWRDLVASQQAVIAEQSRVISCLTKAAVAPKANPAPAAPTGGRSATVSA